jgi:F-box protein 11
MGEPIAFLSYTRFDDAHEEGKITQFCERLSAEVKFLTGREFPIFRDNKDIKWGQSWRSRIEQGLDAAVFLIPILTPSYFQSQACLEEYELFKKREEQLGRHDLILPVYYVECDEMADPGIREANACAMDMDGREYVKWHNLRWEPWTSPAIGRAFEKLALDIKGALRTAPAPARQPASSRARRAAMPRTEAAGTVGSEPALAGQATTARGGPVKEPTTHVVDAMLRGNFDTIGAAIAAAQPGDRILIRPGLYEEGIVLDKPLEIIGDGDVNDIVVRVAGSDVILFRASMGIVRNLTLQQTGGGGWYAVDIGQGRLVLRDCDITSHSLACVAIHGGADPQVRGNRIHDGKEPGVFVQENGLGTFEDNDIFGNARAGVGVKEGGNPTVRGNRIHDGKQGGVFVYEHGLGTFEGNDISGNAYSGVEVREGGNPTVRRNRIHDNGDEAVYVHKKGAGTFEDNDLRGNSKGAWDIAPGCKVTRARNQE